MMCTWTDNIQEGPRMLVQIDAGGKYVITLSEAEAKTLTYSLSMASYHEPVLDLKQRTDKLRDAIYLAEAQSKAHNKAPQSA